MTRPNYIPAKQEQLVDASDTSGIPEMAKELRAIMDQKQELETNLKEVNKRLDDLSKKLSDVMESAGVDGFKVAKVGTVYIKENHHPSTPNKDAFLAWLDKNNMQDLAPRTVHPARLKSLVTELLGEGKPLPDGVTDFVQRRAVIRRS